MIGHTWDTPIKDQMQKPPLTSTEAWCLTLLPSLPKPTPSVFFSMLFTIPLSTNLFWKVPFLLGESTCLLDLLT